MKGFHFDTKKSKLILKKNTFYLKDIKNDAEEIAPVKNDYRVFGTFCDSIATSTIDRRYAKYLKEANVKKIVIHEFRHSHASYLINKNCNPLVLAN